MKINFIKFRLFSIGLGILTCLISMIGFVMIGMNYGVDLAGGISVQVSGQKHDYQNFHNVVQLSDNTCIIKCNSEAELKNISQDKIQVMKVIGAKSIDTMNNFYKALVYALVAMMIYVWFKFSLDFALLATGALIHDVMIIIGYYVFTQAEMNETAVISFLYTIAYSINDTVVIFDRIRMQERINNITIQKSLNDTLKRTTYTSLTTAIALLSLTIFGGKSIQELSTPMLVGLIAGTYSSIFIAGPGLSYIRK